VTLFSRLFRRSHHRNVPAHRTITFWSPVSTGKTHLAAATALSLAAAGNQVALVDLDVATPSLPRASYSLDDVAAEVVQGTFDPNRAATALPRVRPGLYLLAGATHPLRSEVLSREVFGALLTAIAAHYDVVICDTSRTLAYVATLASIDAADTLVIPVTPDELAAWHVARYLSLLEHDLTIDPARFTVVLNHTTPHRSDPQIVTQLLKRPLAAQVPYLPRPSSELWPPSLPQSLLQAIGLSNASSNPHSADRSRLREEGVALGSGD